MNSTRKTKRNTNTEQTVLVLQGGGALGAYQAGVYDFGVNVTVPTR